MSKESKDQKEPIQDQKDETPQPPLNIMEKPKSEKSEKSEFSNKLDLTPVIKAINELGEKLTKKDEPLKMTPILETPKPEPRKYQILDELDPSL